MSSPARGFFGFAAAALAATLATTIDGLAQVKLTWGSAPHPGSVAREGPSAPRRSLAGALCAPTAIRRSQREQNSPNAPRSRIVIERPILAIQSVQRAFCRRFDGEINVGETN